MSLPTKRSNARRVYTIAVVVFWLVMMASLAYRELGKSRGLVVGDDSPLAPAAIARTWRDYSEYALLVWQGATVGAMGTSITREQSPTPRYLLELHLEAQPRPLGGAGGITLSALAELNADLVLNRFRLLGRILGADFAMNGLISSDRELFLELRRGEERTRLRFKLEQPISLAEVVRPLALRTAEIRSGASFRVPVMDPLWSMQIGVLEITVGDIETLRLPDGEIQAWRVESRLNDFVSTSWVDAAGRPVRRQLFGGLWLDRTTAQRALEVAPTLASRLEFVDLQPSDFADVPQQPISEFGSALASSSWLQGFFTRR
ncbi:hypothetical protein BRCON_1761 [Candidatus Sumerlaea chitinivorans]|uniref:Uncharacterized protein n=1 Tax=Sumerlaea chitinivorans TaxID=2250252 RepID=A0A2Z4Y6S8_SUMC1|nr:hypothetical protein BRCON_1761 [Candidatus Sumerlaea chitinivorans]